MIIGPPRALFMDEISNGLDSSTTFQIVTCLRQLTDSTILVSLLQPGPETFDLFDDIILMAEGNIVYHGPCSNILEFFEHCGFKCPPRKGVADFLQELVVVALVTMTVFIQDRNKIDAIHANHYMSSLFYALDRLLVNGLSKLAPSVTRLPILYKQRDFYFYPAWASIPSIILKVPFSLLDAFLWSAITYYVIGYSPEPERFFCHFLVLFFLHQASASLYRLIASLVRNPAASCGLLSSLLAFLFGGFIIPYRKAIHDCYNKKLYKYKALNRNVSTLSLSTASLPAWLQWGFWISPLAYTEIGISINEFLSPRWQKILYSSTNLGHQVLKNSGLNFSEYFYWVSIAALFGFWIVFNIGFTLALTYLKSQGSSRIVISQSYLKGKDNLSNVTEREELCSVNIIERLAETKTTEMVLPFEPITLTSENIRYFVDTPKKLKDQDFPQKRQVLQDITDAFRTGILTALMGVTGGKKTLMDVLSGRTTSGIIEREVRVGGYPKVQETYARVSGYSEQSDIHCPQITVEESVIFLAWLRLPAHIDRHKICNISKNLHAVS
ncbi:hypothetical protein Ddye_029272 [Dipteronia dyeriana]|uniref:ABC transporter domain-containing protein n=1 Tax=Dipteronia dyeriana TaxID=168575 RepID=A0AAD9TFD8_9ROSI|nr:hypothetical protein Ddye_029272 [Dipteronia dyeriana]